MCVSVYWQKCFKQDSLGFVLNAHDLHSVLYLIQGKVLHVTSEREDWCCKRQWMVSAGRVCIVYWVFNYYRNATTFSMWETFAL